MKKVIVIALCLAANFSFGYKIGPRSTTDSLAITTWTARNEQLAEEGRVAGCEKYKVKSSSRSRLSLPETRTWCLES